MFRFKLVIDLLVEFLVRACSLGDVEVAAADDVDAVVLEVERGGDIFETAKGKVLIFASDLHSPSNEMRRERTVGGAFVIWEPRYPYTLSNFTVVTSTHERYVAGERFRHHVGGFLEICTHLHLVLYLSELCPVKLIDVSLNADEFCFRRCRTDSRWSR